MSRLDELAQAGLAAINEKRFDDAVKSFADALALDAERPDLNNALGMAYLHRGEPGTAVTYLAKAVALSEAFDDREHAAMKLHFFGALATAYQLMDRIAEAIEVLGQAVERWPDQLDPRLQLGQLLLSSCRPEEGVKVYQALAEMPQLDDDRRKAAQTVHDAIRAFLDSDDQADVFLLAHQDGYKNYFDEIAAGQEGWYAEAARMSRSAGGDPKPILTEGARPYAMSRADLVNPENGEVASVYSDVEPMICAVEGLEPLAQLPIMLPWQGHPFEVWVGTNCPWHWLTITVQFRDAAEPDALIEAVDDTIGDWYLAGFNGDFGTKETGRFHYITDPMPLGDRAVSYTVDLGRASYDAILALLNRLVVLHERKGIERVLFGQGYLPS